MDKGQVTTAVSCHMAAPSVVRYQWHASKQKLVSGLMPRPALQTFVVHP